MIKNFDKKLIIVVGDNMNKKNPIILYIFIFISFFTVSISFFYFLNFKRFNLYLNTVRNSSELLINEIANGISSGYFQWDMMYESIKNDDKSTYETYFEEIKELHSKYIKAIKLINRNIDFDSYYMIKSKNNNIYIIFNILDDYKEKILPNMVVEMELNISKILKDIDQEKNIIISENGEDFLYGLKVKSKKGFLLWGHYVSSFSIALLAILLYYVVSTTTLKMHYESKGLLRIIQLFEHKDKYTANHSRNVAIISYYLGESMNLNNRNLKKLYNAALLHDIGKIGIPEHILNKHGKLSEEEFEIMKKHTIIGAEIVSIYPEISNLSKIILYHHEKLDGSGYPERLKGNQIPLLSQLITVADIFEALTSNRSYRSALSPDEALKIMENMPINKDAFNILKKDYKIIIKLLK